MENSWDLIFVESVEGYSLEEPAGDLKSVW